MASYLDHVGYRVADLDWYIRFFEEVFDMPAEKQRTNPGGIREVWLTGGLQLVEDKECSNQDGRAHHLCLITDDLEDARAKALAHGCAETAKHHWVKLPDGLQIELFTALPGAIETLKGFRSGKIMTLQQFFSEHPQVALAFSGGVDSAYLLYVACQAGADVRAYYVKTAFQPEFEYEDACLLAQQLGADLRTLRLDVLSDEAVTANPANRCYFCKRRIFTAITEAAKADGYSVLLDGTNASDQVSDRPGMKALQELEVLSPLRLCGLTKTEIRRLSKEAGLFTHDKPAYACLATRIPTGTVITAEALERTEICEGFLMGLGFSGFRIRLAGKDAKLQMPEHQLPLLMEKREAVLAELKKYYSSVLLDLEVRNEQ